MIIILNNTVKREKRFSGCGFRVSRYICGYPPTDEYYMTNPVFEQIQQDINDHAVVLYMKGTKKIPQCGFSATVAQVLERMGIADYKDVNVLADAEIREGIKAFTNWPTIPQLYVKGEFIGGCDIIREMYQTGELEQLLKDKGVIAA
jgi:monothiol glutaredoxin